MDRANGGAGAAGSSAAVNRAERFEDEKRRIIDSCFNKKDVDGSLLETYITHIRITEYSSHPSTPPPPHAKTPEVQKPRIIIVAVRKSGRVRMHKSKENGNGTFSIGKTWNLDDLTHIESYTGPQVAPTHREWAGEAGFLVTLGKPYFWQANSDKEKKFFIASLVKIYGKYTGGKVPELSGFEQKEFDQIMGAGRRPPVAAARQQQQPAQAEHPPPAPSQPAQPAAPLAIPLAVPQAGPHAPHPPPPAPGPGPGLAAAENPRFARTPPARPPIHNGASPAASMESGASRDRPPPPRWLAQSNRSQDSVATSLATRSDDASSIPPRSRNGIPPPGSSHGRFGDPSDSRPQVLGGISGGASSSSAEVPPPRALEPGPPRPPLQPQDRPSQERPPTRERPSLQERPPTRERPPPIQDRPPPMQDRPPQERPPPERRRPPMDPTRPLDRDLVPPPLTSLANKRDPVAPPPRSSERTAPRKDSSSQLSTNTSTNESFQEREITLPLQRPQDPPKPEVADVPLALKPPSAVSLPRFAASSGISPARTPDRAPSPPPPSAPVLPAALSVPTAPPAPIPPPAPLAAPVEPPKPPKPPTPEPVREPEPPKPSKPSVEALPSEMPAQLRPGLGPMIRAKNSRLDLTDEDEDEATDKESRPGLGPMIKSKKTRGEIAGAFWKAASAASAATAFKPRPGGAGERLRQMAVKAGDGPDGITSVVPAPPRPASSGKDAVDRPSIERPSTERPSIERPSIERPSTADRPKSAGNRKSLVPEVKITVPSSRPGSSQGTVPQEVIRPAAEILKEQEKEKEKEKEKNKETEKEKAAARRKITSNIEMKYLQSLGVDSSILDDRSEEFGHWLDYFGWIPGDKMRTRNIDEMKADLDRELNKAQAGGWLARFREEDERVDAIKSGIDVAMAECEELDNLLTLYSVELSTLSDDISYIEAQGQGLQVQTANQKLLKKELESLLDTCAITVDDLRALRKEPLDNIRSLELVETALVTLFKAMAKIDPTLGGADPSKAVESEQVSGLSSDFGNMRIVQEKKQMYMQESHIFMNRLMDFVAKQFDAAYNETKLAMDGALSRKVDSTHHDLGRDVLWKYSPLMLYARDVDLENWNVLIQIYQDKSQPVYRVEFQSVMAIWRKNARKMTGEEAELLFSTQLEKQQQESSPNMATTARKLTVKRSQTLARALRSPLADGERKAAHAEKAAAANNNDSRSLPYEVFAGVLDDLLPLVQMEQNFIVDFFHATTLEHVDFPDAVAARAPRDRRGADLRRPRPMEPDRELARRVTRAMDVIFQFLETELQRLMEWVVGQDPLQGVGTLAALEKKLSEISQSNQDFLNSTLQKLHGFLETRFKKFVDDQLRAIEETKVKINKRKGVISFFRVFPTFSVAVENMLAGADVNLGARATIDREYDRILKTMFDSLMVIARENPAVSVTSGSADPEDKEALNFHILLIENMNHFLEETDTRGLDVLEEWKDQANATYHEHMNLYLNAVMRRPLGKVLEHLEGMEAQLQSGKSGAAIAAQASNSKSVFNKMVSNYDAKEVRKGIEALRKRVEKHFGDADDPMLSRGLVGKVLRECENFYSQVEARIGRITTDVYGGDVLFEWPRADVKAAFR